MDQKAQESEMLPIFDPKMTCAHGAMVHGLMALAFYLCVIPFVGLIEAVKMGRERGGPFGGGRHREHEGMIHPGSKRNHATPCDVRPFVRKRTGTRPTESAGRR